MGSNSGIIFRIKKYAIHDGPGIRTTVFLKGCPLNCWWCHNPEGIQLTPEVCPSDEVSGEKRETLGKEMTVAEVMAAVEKDIIFYDDSGGGVTFSGGEPLRQPDFLFALLDACGRRDIHTVLDTSGYAPADIFRAALEKVDRVLFDLKLMDPAAHKKFTGVSNERVLANFQVAAQSGKVQARFPVIPGITDHLENIDRLAELAASSGRVKRFDLLPYHRTATAKYQRLGLENRMNGSEPPTPEQMEIVKERITRQGLTVHVGG